MVQRGDGRHSHIDPSGSLLHGRWFLDLDVFHKNHARARDDGGWHHVEQDGQALYQARFKAVEPFYNGQARVEGFDGSLSVIGESGERLLELRKTLCSPLEDLSGDMVGMWRTQTIRAATELGVFEALPASAQDVERSLKLPVSMGTRLMRALTELGLVRRDDHGVYHATDKGSLLQWSHPLSLADAASLWGSETYAAWSEATYSLRTGRSAFSKMYGMNLFRPARRQSRAAEVPPPGLRHLRQARLPVLGGSLRLRKPRAYPGYGRRYRRTGIRAAARSYRTQRYRNGPTGGRRRR